MPDNIQYDDAELFNPETHHEHSDVPVRPLWWAIVIFVVFAVLSHIVLWYLYKAFVRGERNRAEAPQTVVQRPADLSVPRNQPLLQPFPHIDDDGVPLPPTHDTPVTDLEKMRRGEDAMLEGYGWIDQQKGIVRIPIEEAKAILAARLAVQSQIGGNTVPGTTAAAPADPSTTTASSGEAAEGEGAPAAAGVGTSSRQERPTTGGPQ